MASTYLQRTMGTPTNNKKWTLSFGLKKVQMMQTHIFLLLIIVAKPIIGLGLIGKAIIL
jgi:hypothetical protein